MSYFVTGATGFIGRHLVERLLEREGDIYVLVREGSEDKLERLQTAAGDQADRLKPVTGDISEPGLGLADEDKQALKGVDHFFHLAAIYDITADDEERNRRLNVLGTQNAVDLANELGAKRFHFASSIAVAGEHDGLFTEDDFDVEQKLTHPYHQTKFEAEKLVRQQAKVPWRVYRPAIVVGDSRTGEMDKIDGPYYFFKAIQKVRHAVPEWFPLVGLEVGRTNIVPVDYVAAAMDHIAHEDGLDGRAFHLVNPKMQKVGDVMNTFASAGHAPHMVLRVDKRMTDMLPKGVLSYAMKLPALKDIRRSVLADMGVPDKVLEYVALAPNFDARDTQRALEGSGIELPPLESYADKLWDYWERNLDPDLFKDRSFEGAVNGKTVIITGASSGIGLAAAHKIAAAGGIPLLVARSEDKLIAAKEEIERNGGTAYALPRRPLRLRLDRRAGREDLLRARRDRHARQQRGPLDPALGGALLRPLPRLRAHDQAQLPRHDQADPRRAPAHVASGRPGTSSTSPRSACRRTRRGSLRTWLRRRRSTPSPAWSRARRSATT